MRAMAGCLCLLMMLILTPGARGAKLPASCGPQHVSVHVQKKRDPAKLGAVPAGEARLVFVQRMGFCLGCGRVVRIGLDGKWVGANKGSSWFAVTVPAGEHHVCAWWDAPLIRLEDRMKLTDLDAKAGQTYYFQTHVNTNAGANEVSRMWLRSISRDQGAFLVSRSKRSIARFETQK